MKRISMIFILVSLLIGSVLCFTFDSNFSNLHLNAEALEPIELNNQNFATEISSSSNSNFILIENIELENWAPINNFIGNLNGNGFTITTDKNLFNYIENSNITNLGVILNEEYVFDNTGYQHSSSDFGIISKSVKTSTIQNVFAVGNFEVKSKSSFNVGGMFGRIESSIIQNCYVKTKFSATQFSDNSLLTVVGGFAGKLTNSTVLNCFAISSTPSSPATPLPTIFTATVNNQFSNPEVSLVLGGFIGLADCGSAGYISNIFCGGTILINFPQQNAKVFKGKIFGEVNQFSAENLSYCHTFNSQSDFEFIGLKDDYNYNDFSFKESAVFGEILNYSPTTEFGGIPLWNFLHNWDISSTWNKNESSQFIVLQVFESFLLMIDENLNEEGVECSVFIYENDVFEETEEATFKYGSRLKIEIKIVGDYINYKQIKALTKNDLTFDADLTFNENLSEASFELTLNASLSGSYYVSTENISFSLIVRTEDGGKGFVNYGTLDENRTNIKHPIYFGGSYVFKAKPISNSFAFSSWNWVDENGEKTVAMRGSLDNNLNAKQSITIAFERSGANAELTYLNLENGFSIPYMIDEESGIITFIIEAEFTTNICDFKIESPLNKDGFSLYIDNILVGNIVDYMNILEKKVQVGGTIEIRIEMKENFVFKGWKTGSGRPISNYIRNDETSMSTTINLTPTSDFILFLDFVEEQEAVEDLLRLWISLGVLGGSGLIALIVVIVIRSSKSKKFLNYY